MRDRCVGEETIVEEGTFESEVDQGVEEVPDKEDAKLGSCRGMKDAEGNSVCCDEDREGCEEREDGHTIDDQGGGRALGLHARHFPCFGGLPSFRFLPRIYSRMQFAPGYTGLVARQGSKFPKFLPRSNLTLMRSAHMLKVFI